VLSSNVVLGSDPLSFSSGVPSLDDYLGGGLVAGDNVVVVAEQGAAAQAVARAFAAEAPEQCAWVRSGDTAVPDGVEAVDLDPALAAGDPEAAVRTITDAAARRPRLVVDGLDEIHRRCGGAATVDLYRQSCPRLFDAGALAVWPSAQGELPASVTTAIGRIAQCVFELRADSIRIVKAEGRPASFQGAVAELRWDGPAGLPKVGRELVVGRLGEGLRRLRRERGLTQRELALLAGVTPAAISQAEAGRRGLSLETLVPLCDRLGIGLDDLLGSRRRDLHVLARRERRQLGVGTTALFEAPDGPLRAYRTALEPRASGVPPFVAKGVELVLVARGLVMVDLGDDTPVMRAGDALMALEEPVLGWTNLGPEPAEIFWVLPGRGHVPAEELDHVEGAN
jgi:transcriptional regulator with XRE-family HTH domain